MLWSQVRLALKVLLRRKVLTAISLFGISFTLTVLMVFASIFDQAVGSRPPEVFRDRTMAIYQAELRGPHTSSSSSAGFYLLDRFARDLPGVEHLTIFSDERPATSWISGRKFEFQLKRTDGAFWQLFRFEFLEGGAYTQDDDDQGAFVAVINESTRRRLFGEDPAVGREIVTDGQTYRVIGVVRDVSALLGMPFAEMWAPLGTTKNADYARQWLGGYRAMLLFRSPDDFDAAREEFRARLAAASVPEPDQYDSVHAELLSRTDHLSTGLFGDERPHPRRFQLVVGLLVLLFMLLPTVNLVNLSLSRILERASEIGVRKSFGASSGALVGQFLVENLVLTLVGGVIGWLLAYFALHLLNAIALVPYARHEMHPRVFLYGLLLTVLFGLVSGAWPAWRMSRLDPVDALRGRGA